MSGDFSAQLQGLYSFNDGIFCKKSKVYSIFDLDKKELSRFKIDEDIDIFDEDMLTLSPPVRAGDRG